MDNQNVALCLIAAVAMLVSGPEMARAQSDAEASAEGPPRVVILNVPGGGTDLLVSQLTSIETIDLKEQDWFVAEIRKHELEPKGIMSNREALSTLMRKSTIDYLVFLQPDETSYTATLLEGPEAESVLEFDVERTDGSLSEEGAKTIGDQYSEFFAPEPPTEDGDQTEGVELPEKTTGGGEEAEETETSGDQNEQASTETEADASSEGSSAPVALWTSGRGRMFRRNFNAAGADNTILSYASRYYPGFEVDARLFPFGGIGEAFAPVGIYVDYNHGFETITVPPAEEGGSPQGVSLSHIEAEAGLLSHAGGELPATRSGALSRFQLKLTARQSWFIVEANDKLPSTSMTSLIVGGLLTEPIIGDRLAAQARLEVIPVALFSKGGELFGETSYSNGFGTRLGLLYALSDRVSLVGGYRFRLHHSNFQGQGASGFRNAEVFELVQGIDVGIQYGH